VGGVAARERDAVAAIRQDDAGGCWACHSGEGALRKFGVRSNYLEKEALVDRNEGFAHITCAVCHDPHSNEFEGQLRFPSNTANIETHICAQCHNRATVPGVGPRGLAVHAPEAPLLDGELHTVGWVPPGTVHDVDRIRGSHGGEANPRLCSTCHVVPFDIGDPGDGPDVPVRGPRLPGDPLRGRQRDPDHRGELPAHPRPATGAAAPTAVTARPARRRASPVGAVAQPEPGPGPVPDAPPDRPEPGRPGGPIDPTNPQFTVAEGAYFNLQLAHHGTPLQQDNFNVSRADSLAALAPSTVHNPFLIRSLLVWSIEAVRNEYGVSPSRASTRRPALRGHSDRVMW
jgi:predicted CXXCH cytochrome family protein